VSTEDVSLAALIVSVALAVILRFKMRERDLGERLSRLARDTEQRRTTTAAPEPPTLGDALARVQAELSTAIGLLNEIYVIGLWAKYDDDNRRKRQALRQTDWAVSGALRALTTLPQQGDVPASIHDLEQELRMLVAILEPLPDEVIDTMGENPALDSTLGNASRKASELLERATQLQGESFAGRGT
jgi:hypothetical protein